MEKRNDLPAETNAAKTSFDAASPANDVESKDGGLDLPLNAVRPLPPATAPLEIRQEISRPIVEWYISYTGGDANPDGGPAGYRWRTEYFQCVDDPQAYLAKILQEFTANDAGTNRAHGS